MDFAIRKMSPKSLIRYAATSKAARAATSPERRRIAALKRLVHRLALRRDPRFFDQRLRPRLEMSLVRAKAAAMARARMTTAQRRQNKERTRWLAARGAYARYLENGNWNKFLRVHAKRGLPPVSRQNAFRMYN
jgi:hypothetical protein